MRDLSRDSTHLYVKEFTQTFLDNVVIGIGAGYNAPLAPAHTPPGNAPYQQGSPLGARTLFYLFELLRAARPAGWPFQVLE